VRFDRVGTRVASIAPPSAGHSPSEGGLTVSGSDRPGQFGCRSTATMHDHWGSSRLQQAEPCQVSVVIPLYNSANTLRRAVISVLRQTMKHLELLIVDDASTDDSLALAHRLALEDRHIRILSLPENRGKSHALNQAIREARGAWIAVLDADYWYEPELLAILATAGDRHGAELAADNQYFHDAAAGVVVRTAFPIITDEQLLTRLAFIAGSDPYVDFNYGMLKPIVRADFVRRVRLAYRENARLSEDFLYLVEFFAAGGTGVLVPRPLYHWTQPFGTLSRQWTTTGAGSWRYDFRAALKANADVLHELRERKDNELAGLLVAQARAFRRLHHLTQISRMRASGSPIPQIVGTVARHPSIWPLLLRRAVRSLRRRHDMARIGSAIWSQHT